MEQKKRKSWKKWLGLGSMALLTAVLAALPKMAAMKQTPESHVSILTSAAERRDMERTLCGGGALEGGEPTLVSVPEGVRVTEFLVRNGDTVTEGDVIAAVDKVSVMTAVTVVQKTLDTLAQKMTALYVNNGEITADENGKLYVGNTAIPENSMESYAEYLTLADQHRDYEEKLFELFRMYRNGTVEAETSGLIHNLDRSVLHNLSAAQGNGRLKLLAAHTPMGDDDKSYIFNFVGVVNSTAEGTYNMLMNPTPFEVTDYADLSGVDCTLKTMTVPGTYPGGAPVFEAKEGEWAYAESVQSGDLLLFTFYDGEGGDSDNLAWIIRLGKAEGWETKDPGKKKEQKTPVIVVPGGWSGGSAAKEPELFSTDTTALCTIVPLDEMTVTVQLDERDIASVTEGMTAALTVDALPGQNFTGEITEISKFGGNQGGSSKYGVTLSLPWSEGMLPGMNTSAVFSLETMENVLCLPVAALNDTGTKTTVYTGYDPKEELLLAPAEVEIGVSDGEYVQILSGVEEGQTVFYSYYDKAEISTEAK